MDLFSSRAVPQPILPSPSLKVASSNCAVPKHHCLEASGNYGSQVSPRGEVVELPDLAALYCMYLWARSFVLAVIASIRPANFEKSR